MKWSNVKLILFREVRDQLRDRRTLFMICVLPVLLYPILGMCGLKVFHFMEEKPSRILVVGARGLEAYDEFPPLFDDRGQFVSQWLADPSRADVFKLETLADEPDGESAEPPDLRAAAVNAVLSGQHDAALYFPRDFADRLEAFRMAVMDEQSSRAPRRRENGPPPRPDIPAPKIIFAPTEKSLQARFRLESVLDRWTDQIGRGNLTAGGLPAWAAEPFQVEPVSLAGKSGVAGPSVWARILPVMLVLWALTGSFYPAVDLCAGEKERCTLETLLSSPAARSEIVLGKLVTVMLFSMLTAALNLATIGLTGRLMLGQFPQFGPIALTAIVWLAVALIPVAALFSALCLAIAAFARSSKEAQYYLMPLLFVVMPLASFSVLPGVELNTGTSLIPVAGIVLLLRAVLEGNYLQALQFCPYVIVVTLAGILFSVNWAIEQFNKESVLFRESERFDLLLWMRHMFRQRGTTPTVGAAVACGVLVLVIGFYINLVVAPRLEGRREAFTFMVLIPQVTLILGPILLFPLLLTRGLRETLLLKRTRWTAIPAGVLLAMVIHPLAHWLAQGVTAIYPPSDAMQKALQSMGSLIGEMPLWQLLLLVAVLPAVCEELAFRGFILSGLRHLGHRWRAIVYSALFFGFNHAILQQSIIASLLGCVIGYLAVQSGSIWPCMAFHVTHNGLQVTLPRTDLPGALYEWPAVLISGMLAVVVLYGFHRLPFQRTEEERKQEAIARALHE